MDTINNMHQPLNDGSCIEDDAVMETSVEERKESVISEFRRVLALAIPVMSSEVLSFASYLITTAQIGHLGSAELSAITLARTTYHITGYSLVVGLASGIETLAGQAFGAGHYQLVGVITQRALIMCLLLSCALLAVWTQSEPLMIMLGQEESIAKLAARYILHIFPSLPFISIAMTLRYYFACMGVVKPLTLIALVVSVATPLVNYYCITVLNLGLDGAAIAYNILCLVEALLLTALVWWLGVFVQSPEQRTWHSWSQASLQGWGQYLRVAVPSTAMICADWWCFECMVYIAGLHHDSGLQVAVMGLCFNTHALAFVMDEGFATAASTRVSNLLGAGRGHVAHVAMVLSLSLAVSCATLCCIGLLLWGKLWIRLFTPDQVIIDATMRAVPFLALALIGDSVYSALGGVLRGAGRQTVGLLSNLGSYWLVGLPVAAYLGAKDGARGMWIAMSAASALQAAILVAATFSFDWDKEVKKAQRRVREGARSFLPRRSGEDVCVEPGIPHHHGVHDPLLAGTEGAV
mmetsp:Transcript_14027/g.30361  ORF Transcript_14027/g.30361 Transcript_14027/m.30361 type:complete len:522 (-) Transcript_14027:229-1794(-)|eukprot:CAMPEP_0202908420 /NCGR_PEP_ID=MMETSP1392-20130828/45942_1 /ASSEMBLY_ACC=CAM_ASM_000868 /TAXON_ID=225041 /ORGANISM="Chlamydomonas chlamydogama, Strain SAG 11-48b" /LENGTH=521 /DNA_ID=CAMNT_0049597739 /DNA_START=150 /DNA_END=1715 /DNA_ORIENTATION=-